MFETGLASLLASSNSLLDDEGQLAQMALVMAATAKREANDLQLQIQALRLLSIALPDHQDYELETILNEAFCETREQLMAPVPEEAAA